MLGGFVIGGVLAAAGLLLWGIAVVLYLRGRSSGRGGVDVEGEVYDHGSYVSRGQQMYFPKYRAVVNGQTLTCGSATATNWKRPPVGTRVKLVHVPSDAEIPLRERGLPIALLIAMIILAVIGTGLLGTGTMTLVASAAASRMDAEAPGPEPSSAAKSPKRKPGHRP